MNQVEEESPETLARDAGQYWRQSASVPWIRDLSHWRGRGRWADDDTWTGMGQRHLQMFQDLRILARHPQPVRSMIEWGPGGGANAVVFAREIGTFYGVDISAANLAECGRQLVGEG